MNSTTSIDLNEVEKQIKETTTVAAIRSVTDILNNLIFDILSDKKNTYTFEYSSLAFFLSGKAFVREGMLLEKELAIAFQTGSIQAQNKALKSLGEFLIGRPLRTYEFTDLCGKIIFSSKGRLGDKVAAHFGETWNFKERIRFQGYFKLWKHMVVANNHHIATNSFVPLFVEFVNGMYQSLDKFNYENEEDAWNLLRPKFTLTIEYELRFLFYCRFSVFGKFQRDMMKIRPEVAVVREDVLARRIPALVINRLKDNKDISAIAFSLSKFADTFDFQKNKLNGKRVTPILEEIKTLLPKLKDKELYPLVAQKLLDIDISHQ